MNFKKTVAIATAAGALAAISVPAMALENEFHGMFRAFGYVTNSLSGGGAFHLQEKSATDKFIEQRARIQYIAKASDDLKLVTHFELDTKFGGQSSTKYPIGDAGGIDADRISLETKNVYLDFNCPITGTNAKVGIQPFNDSYQGTFSNFDGTGVLLSKKFSAFTGTYGYFVINSDAVGGTAGTIGTPGVTAGTGTTFPSYRRLTHMNVVDANFAVNNDISVGANYTNVIGPDSSLVYLHMIGLNAAAKVGPAALALTAGYQLGDAPNVGTTAQKFAAYGITAAAKVDVGVGKVNVSALYLSGDKTPTTPDSKNTAWQVANTTTTYFPAANMWLIARNAATINSSTAIGGTSDMTRGGRGILGAFAGFEGALDKIFYNANVGWAKVAEKQAADSADIGTELNATVGYKLYSNLSASFTAAYAILGDGYKKDIAQRATDTATTGNTNLLPGGVRKADNSFLTNIALNYAF